MTIKEAINHLCTFSSTNGSGQTSQDQHKEAKRMAIAALEKQLPEKPIKSKVPRYGMGYEYHDWVCPTCGTYLAPEPQRKGNHHCVCGQAIDWSEDK